MSSLPSLAPPVRAPFPPHGVAFSEQPLDRYVADQAAFYLALGTERGLLVAETLQSLAREIRCCSTPGKPLSLEDFYDRRASLEAEADFVEWPPRGSWVDQTRFGTTE